MESRQENTGANIASSKLMAVDDEADITFTLKSGLELSAFSLDVFKNIFSQGVS